MTETLTPQREVDALREALADVIDVATWMSGSPSFSPEGEAGEAWAKTMRPKLFAAMDVLAASSLFAAMDVLAASSARTKEEEGN